MADDKVCDPTCPALARREFLTAAALTALTVLEAACGNGQIGPADAAPGVTTGGSTTTPSGGIVVRLSAFPALASTGGAARVDPGSGTPVALVRTGASSFAAFSLRCPHEGYTVNVQATRFLCPAHGAQFALNGTWQGGQRTSNLHGLSATYDAVAGTVTIV